MVVAQHEFGIGLVAATLLMVVTYIFFTQRITDWRNKLREEMNELDTATVARSVDSLLNYETVKYFNAEDREAGEEQGVLDLVLPGEQLDHRLDRHQREPEGATEGGDEERAQQRANGCGHLWSEKSGWLPVGGAARAAALGRWRRFGVVRRWLAELSGKCAARGAARNNLGR